ncbi:MAG: methyltransferase domain-containing protein, partial [Deltaproteobacteria bacterium]|nr:methyltransferase domain-containing protein [Deltaproteobacteria bacterium]
MKNKEDKRRHFDSIASDRDRWKDRNRYYHDNIENLISFLIPQGLSVLEIGCGTGDLLACLQPQQGLGVDFSEGMINKAREKYPKKVYPFIEFQVDDAEDLHIEETFDYVVMSDLLGELSDIWATLRNLKNVTRPDTRIVITYFNTMWEPILRLGERLGLKMPQDYQSWLSLTDIENLLALNGIEVITKDFYLLVPKKIPILSS